MSATDPMADDRVYMDDYMQDPTCDGQWSFDRAANHYVYFFRVHDYDDERYRRDPRELTLSHGELEWYLNFYRWVMCS